MLYLIDSSAWIQTSRANASLKLKNLVEDALQENTVIIIPLIKYELLQGAVSSAEFKLLNKQLGSLIEDNCSNLNWEEFYQFGFELKRKGVTVPTIDALIAYRSIEKAYTLVHHDKHFKLIAKEKELNEISFIN